MITTSIILINYNNADLTKQAISSILTSLSNSKIEFEIIVVDNCSKIDDSLKLEKNIQNINSSKIKFIKSRINVGFGAGNMIGVQYAIGEYYTFMNNDVILETDILSEMISFLDKTPNAAIAGAQPIDIDRTKAKAFDYGLSYTTELFSNNVLQFLAPKKYFSRYLNSNSPVKVGAVPGSLLICKAQDFNDVGGFDTNIFLYYEEKDLSFRINKYLNKDTYSLPYLEYIHLEGKSTTPSQAIKNELKISQFYTLKKNLNAYKYIFFYIYSLIRFLIKSPFSKKNRALLMLLVKGISPAHSLKHKQKIV